MILEIQTPRVFKPLLVPSRYKGIFGGRGSGKSWYFAEALVEQHIMRKINSVCVREVQKSLSQSVKKLIEIKIEAMGVGHLFEVYESHIKAKNGGIIIFLGMSTSTQDSIKSLESYDIAWIEEAQSLSQRSLDLLRPTIRAPGSEIWASWNPNFETDPIDALLRGGVPPPDSIVIKSNYCDNPWFPDVLRDEMEYDKGRDPDKYAHVWLGDYIRNSEARVFKNWVIDEFDAPDGTCFNFGADWGYSIDPSVLIRSYIQGNKLYIDYEAYLIGCEIVNLPSLFATVPESEKWFIVADSARPETISYMQQNGYPKMSAAIKGVGSIEEGVTFLQSHDIVVHTRCKHTIDELSTYRYKTDKMTDKITPILEDKNNHVIDSLRYACESARRFKAAKTVNRKPRESVSWRL